jgi:uncharacterized protein (UPF0333 family)
MEYVLVAITIVQGAYLGKFDTNYEVLSTYKTKQTCVHAMNKIAKDDFKVYTCMKVDKN